MPRFLVTVEVPASGITTHTINKPTKDASIAKARAAHPTAVSIRAKKIKEE